MAFDLNTPRGQAILAEGQSRGASPYALGYALVAVQAGGVGGLIDYVDAAQRTAAAFAELTNRISTVNGDFLRSVPLAGRADDLQDRVHLRAKFVGRVLLRRDVRGVFHDLERLAVRPNADRVADIAAGAVGIELGVQIAGDHQHRPGLRREGDVFARLEPLARHHLGRTGTGVCRRHRCGGAPSLDRLVARHGRRPRGRRNGFRASLSHDGARAAAAARPSG